LIDGTAPHKILPGASPNDKFVARARRANLVVSLLIDELREGTRGELEAVLNEDEIELSVVWCEDREGEPYTEVSRWLALQDKRIIYDRAGRPDQTGPKIALARLATEAALLGRNPPIQRIHAGTDQMGVARSCIPSCR